MRDYNVFNSPELFETFFLIKKGCCTTEELLSKIKIHKTTLSNRIVVLRKNKLIKTNYFEKNKSKQIYSVDLENAYKSWEKYQKTKKPTLYDFFLVNWMEAKHRVKS